MVLLKLKICSADVNYWDWSLPFKLNKYAVKSEMMQSYLFIYLLLVVVVGGH